MDISIDGSLLFVALDGGGAVVFLDLETFNFNKLESARNWVALALDVIEGRLGRVFVSAHRFTQSSFITMIDRDANNAATRVTDNRFTPSRPTLASSPDGTTVYVGDDGIAPNSLYKLDISENPGLGVQRWRRSSWKTGTVTYREPANWPSAPTATSSYTASDRLSEPTRSTRSVSLARACIASATMALACTSPRRPIRSPSMRRPRMRWSVR